MHSKKYMQSKKRHVIMYIKCLFLKKFSVNLYIHWTVTIYKLSDSPSTCMLEFVFHKIRLIMIAHAQKK